MNATVAVQAKLDQAKAAHQELEGRRPPMDSCVWGMVLCVAGFVLSRAQIYPWWFVATGAGFMCVVYCWVRNWRWGRRMKASGERVGELRRRLRATGAGLTEGTRVEVTVQAANVVTGERIAFPTSGVVAEVEADGMYIDHDDNVRIWVPRAHWGCCVRPVGPEGR